MGSTSFWQAEQAAHAPAALQRAPLGEALPADVAIIGGGITGTAAAVWCARAGARVALLEAREIAAAASGRNGGFLLGGTAGTYAGTIAQIGRERARRAWAFSLESHRLARRLIEELRELGLSCGYERNGSLRIAVSEDELAEVLQSVRLLEEDGWEATPISVAELPAKLRHAYLGGSFHPMDGEIQPAQFVRGIARLAQRAGARIYEGSAVTALAEAEDHVLVSTTAGSVRAAHAILATNVRLPELLAQIGAGALGATITPARGQMLATAPLDEELFPCPCYADAGYQYWRQLRDGRLVVGGWRNASFDTERTEDETPGAPVQDRLDGFVRQTLGLSAARAPVERRWAGIMAFSADGLPLVGRVPGTRRCYVAGAYTGHGNAYALSAARLLADLIAGERPADADLFDPARFTAPAR
ncbi:MAG TPA: FAD-dependent oxidoreductase [Ktedonobacterales bacterium]|nr:FAD-dependent oxidoreductase [Ktedonobacterales bacterium]